MFRTLVTLLVVAFACSAVAAAQSRSSTMQLEEVARFKTELTSFNNLLLTKNGELLLAQSTLGRMEVWDVASKKRLWAQQTDSYDHRFSAEEAEFMWLDQRESPAAIVRTKLRTGQEIKRTELQIERVKLCNAAFALEKTPLVAAQAEYADGNYLLTITAESGELHSIAKLPFEAEGKQVEINGLDVSPQGDRFLLTAKGGLILVDDQCQVLQRFATDSNVSRIRFLPGGKRAVAADVVLSSPVYFLELATGKVTERGEHRFGIDSLEISTNGKWAASGGRSRFAAERNYYLRNKTSEGGELVLWNLETSSPVAKLNPALDSLDGIALSADGHWLATAETGDFESEQVVYKVREK